MRIRWRNFELPSQVRMDQDTASPQVNRVVIRPLENGYGAKIPNRVRRARLSSTEGTALT